MKTTRKRTILQTAKRSEHDRMVRFYFQIITNTGYFSRALKPYTLRILWIAHTPCYQTEGKEGQQKWRFANEFYPAHRQVGETPITL